MNPTVVVDVGNTRIKWGRCAADRVVEMASLQNDDEAAWRQQLVDWKIAPAMRWVLSGVQPLQRDKLRDWLVFQGQKVIVIDSLRQIPVCVDVEYPDKVGLDRLFNAAAFNAVRPADSAGVIVDAGTAVTVDYVDATGIFRGGAILPGRSLMANALHDYTALLPLLNTFDRVPGPTARILVPAPATNTLAAMSMGITEAVLGGIERLVKGYSVEAMGPCQVILTGGDSVLADYLTMPMRLWPEMTLEGIRRSVLTHE